MRLLQIANAADARSYWGAIMPDVVANHDAEVLILSKPSKRPVSKCSSLEGVLMGGEMPLSDLLAHG